jgi:hypothetical protein
MTNDEGMTNEVVYVLTIARFTLLKFDQFRSNRGTEGSP